MAAAVSQILNGIRLALLGPAVWGGFAWGDGTLLGGATKSSPYYERVLVGRKHLESNLGPPCIVLVADEGNKFVQPQGPGRNAKTPIMASKTLAFEAHCWGAANPTIFQDVYTQSEELADAVMTATRALVGTGNTRATTEKWFPSGQAGAGEMLVRLFEVDGIGIPEVKLPLDRPIDLALTDTVTAIGPNAQTAPYDDSGAMASDTSIGVTHGT